MPCTGRLQLRNLKFRLFAWFTKSGFAEEAFRDRADQPFDGFATYAPIGAQLKAFDRAVFDQVVDLGPVNSEKFGHFAYGQN